MAGAAPKTYKIGEACRAVDIQPYVLRYWESEFSPLKAGAAKSGARVYTEQEVAVVRRIKELLYEEGYTIAGAKKRLESELADGKQLDLPSVSAEGEAEEPEEAAAEETTGVEVEEPEGEEVAEIEEETAEEPVAAAAEEVADEDVLSEVEAVGEAEEAALEGESGAEEEDAAVAAAEPIAEEAPAPAEEPEPPEPEAPEESAAEPVAAAPASVDTSLAERVETLEQGVVRALAEVRDLLALLEEGAETTE